MTTLRLLLALGVMGAAAGCAARPFDAHFEAGRFAEAARLFDADSALHRDQRALLRAAIVHVLPTSPAYHPERARELLHRMLTLHPDGEHAPEGTRLLILLYEVDRLTKEAERLRRRSDSLSHQITLLEEERRSLQESLERERLQADVLRTLAERLEADLRRTEFELRTLQNDLQLLKAVDLQRLRGGGATGPQTAPDSGGSADSSGARSSSPGTQSPPDSTTLWPRQDTTETRPPGA